MKKYIKYILTAAFFASLAACLEILSFTHPETAPVDTVIDVSMGIEVNVDENIDRNSHVIVGILAPVSWNVAGNAVITYSSSNMPEGPVTDMPMRLTTDADLNADKKRWDTAMTEKIGSRGNYEPVEWVSFISVNQHNWPAGSTFDGVLDIKLKTGNENVKTILSYFVGNSTDGVNDDRSYYLLRDQVFTTTGADGPTTDYTVPKICTVEPDKFTWEDIVMFNYNATVRVDDMDSPLKGADEVYFIATALYDKGSKSVTVDEISEKTRMWKGDEDKWFLYIYPHEYFSIPADEKIDTITFYIVNADRSIEVRMPDGEDFEIPENNV